MSRKLLLLVCLSAIAGWLIYSRLLVASVQPAASLPPRIPGSKVYFVPIGSFPNDQLDSLVRYYHKAYNLDITVLKSIPVDEYSRDASRQQLVAEKLDDNLRDSFPEYADNPARILIGFTSEDMYPMSMDWQFAFGWRKAGTGTAVVSTARLGLPYTGDGWSFDVPGTRLRKIVTKDIGILYYGMPQSSNPKSVLYNHIMGIEELDQEGEDF